MKNCWQLPLLSLWPEHDLVVDFLESMWHEFSDGADCCGLAAAITKAAKRASHDLIHLPADPTCPVCLQAKLIKTAARKQPEESREFASSFGELIHCDLVGQALTMKFMQWSGVMKRPTIQLCGPYIPKRPATPLQHGRHV